MQPGSASARRRAVARLAVVAVASLVALAAGACADRPEPPRMLNAEPPFHYPDALYRKKVQGNVVLRLYVDAAGAVRPESTRIAESSGYVALDSSAVRGSEELRFAPARRDGESMAMSILFPVHFRHPGAPPMPGDTGAGG